MNRFLFITHITPHSKRSALRQKLITVYYESLCRQKSTDWKVAVLGEREWDDERFHYFTLPDIAREEKPALISTLLKSTAFQKLLAETDYVVKLDDDDIVSPLLLSKLSDFNGDLYYDEWHTFNDITSGQVTQQKRNWIASTCVHRKECAFDTWTGAGASPVGNVLYSDHSKAWHVYYQGKSVHTSDKNQPCYLRVLSPTSVTSSQRKKADDAVDYREYYRYLSQFGEWKPVELSEFKEALESLAAGWLAVNGSAQIALPDFTGSMAKRIGSRIKRMFGG